MNDERESIIKYLNRTFPGSNWEISGPVIILNNYDLNVFSRVMEQKIPQRLWLIFSYVNNRFVLYPQDFNIFLDFIKDDVREEHKSTRIDFIDIVKIRKAILSLNLASFLFINEISPENLILKVPSEDKAMEIFPYEILSIVVLQDNKMIVPLNNIKIVVDYLEQIFPVVYPTPELVKEKLAQYLRQLIQKLELWKTRYYNFYLSTQDEVEVIKLSQALPIPLEKKTWGLGFGRQEGVFDILNQEQIYSALWETAVRDNFRREFSSDLLDSVTIRELKNIISEHITEEDTYLQFWERELFDVSRKEYLKDVLELPPALNDIIASYV